MYLIRDHVQDAQRFPLTKLLELVANSIDTNRIIWTIKKARGYGEQICEIEDNLMTMDEVKVTANKLIDISKDDEQWFYDLECYNDEGMKFGIIDSNFLFIEASEKEVSGIIRQFDKVSKITTVR